MGQRWVPNYRTDSDGVTIDEGYWEYVDDGDLSVFDNNAGTDLTDGIPVITEAYPGYVAPDSTWAAGVDESGNKLPSASGSGTSGGSLWDIAKGWFMKDGKLDLDALRLAAAGVGGIAGLIQNKSSSGSSGQQKIGYQGSIPKLQANRTRLPLDDANRVPGSAGRRYFSDLTYSPVPKATADTPATTPATPPVDTFPRDPRWGNPNSSDYRGGTQGALASGGIAGLAAGGSTGEPRYLAGGTDGMADELHASIDDKQPAKLSHGEFVIPADVVGHLGNGNSEAGAKRLYEMMARIRKARTGNPDQGKRINPNKFLPS